MQNLLSSWPEKFPGSVESIREKSDVLPVPLNLTQTGILRKAQESNKIEIVWNHRWEFDKGPEQLLSFLRRFHKILEKFRHKQFLLHIVGAQFREQPGEFLEIKAVLNALVERHPNCLPGFWGFIAEREKYQSLLEKSTIVLSTSMHDFQGLSILEAVAAGCTPLLPNKLAYPESFDHTYLYDWHDTADQVARNAIGILDQWLSTAIPEPPDVSKFEIAQLAASYRKKILSLR